MSALTHSPRQTRSSPLPFSLSPSIQSGYAFTRIYEREGAPACARKLRLPPPLWFFYAPRSSLLAAEGMKTYISHYLSFVWRKQRRFLGKTSPSSFRLMICREALIMRCLEQYFLRIYWLDIASRGDKGVIKSSFVLVLGALLLIPRKPTCHFSIPRMSCSQDGINSNSCQKQ